MIQVAGEEDEKSRQNNQRKQHSEQVADSAMMLVNGGAQKEAQSAQPFTDSIYTLNEGGYSTPSYSVDDVMGGMIQPTEAPQRDAAAYERLQNQAKLNVLSKGLQAVFGAYVGSQGDVVPGPYEGGMTQSLMQNAQKLDDKYFREMAEYRDRELRGQLFNANQEARNNDIRLQKMRDDVKNLTNARRYEEAQKAQAEADEYQRGLDAKKLNMRQQEINIRREGGGRDQEEKRGVPEEHKSLYDQAIKEKISALKAQRESALDPDAIDEEIEAMETLPYTFGDKSGLAERTYREALSNAYASQGKNQRLNDMKSTILNSIQQGNVNPDQAAQDFYAYFSELTGDDKAAREATQNALRGYGIVKEDEQVVPPSPEDFEDPLDYTEAKIKWDKGATQRAETSVVKEKKGVMKAVLSDALLSIGDDKLAQRVKNMFNNQPESAVREVLKNLKKDLPKEKQPDLILTSHGSQPRIKSKQENFVDALESALEDFTSHNKKYGQR